MGARLEEGIVPGACLGFVSGRARLVLALALVFLSLPVPGPQAPASEAPAVRMLANAPGAPSDNDGSGEDDGGSGGDDDCPLHPIVGDNVPNSPQEVVGPCTGIRPGGALILRRQGTPIEVVYCSMAFIVTDEIHRYVATAGHCTLEEFGVPKLGERVAAHGIPGTFGTVAFTWCQGEALGGGCGVGTDFALIRIDPDKYQHVNHRMCGWGAASGLFTARDDRNRELRHFGWGLGVGGTDVGVRHDDLVIQPGNHATQARRSIGFDFTHSRYARGRGPAVSGDSGSAVLVTALPDLPSLEQPNPRALGILTHIAVGNVVYVQRMDAGLQRASQQFDRPFRLWTP